MHITKFDKGFTRRYFMESAGKAAAGAGMLAPLWDVIGRDGDITKAYPEEAMSIEALTNGRVKVGGQIDASNVDAVRDMIDDGIYLQIAQQGRVIDIVPTTRDIYHLNPKHYLDATLKNRGKAGLDKKGNVVLKGTDKPWIGGNPFPNATTAHEIIAGHSLSWGRHDSLLFPVWERDKNPAGETLYRYEFMWIENYPVVRTTLEPKPYVPGMEHIMRHNVLLFTTPQDVRGTSLLNIWPYDQTKFPEFFGYLPQFKRIRRFPTNQRFEPVIPGSVFFLSDAWMTGDPFLTWGNFKIVAKVPWLGGVSNCWSGSKDGWLHDRVGGQTGDKFFRSSYELCPECYVIDMDPIAYPRAPYGKKRIVFDARTMTPITMIAYDRRGDQWKSWEQAYDWYSKRGVGHDPSTGPVFKMRDAGAKQHADDVVWTWAYAVAHDIQSDYITIFQHIPVLTGGVKLALNDPNIYSQYCTIPAIRRMGT
jgi:hypothetical protein